MKKLVIIGLLTFSSLSQTGWAGLARLGTVSTEDQCGSYSTDLIEAKEYDHSGRGIVGESLRVFFDQFVLKAEKQEVVSRNCKLTAEVKIPAGYKFRPTLAVAEGFYQIEPQSNSRGGIKVGYTVHPSGQSAWRENPKPFSGTGNIFCKAELTDPNFTTCYNKEHSVSLETKLGFWLDQGSPGFSVMQLDASRSKTSLKWNWQFQTCENFFDQKMFSVYLQDIDGQYFAGKMFFDLSNGRIDLGSDKVAWLYNVSYSPDGLTASANWYTDYNKKSGWLKITMNDVGNGAISGEWGDSQSFKVMIHGDYENAKKAHNREFHQIHSPDQALCLESFLSQDNSSITATSCDYGSNQQFYFQNVENQQYFHIKSRRSGKCLVSEDLTPDYKIVETTTCGESGSDTWEFYIRGQSPFRLKNKTTGLCMQMKKGDYFVRLVHCDSSDASFFTWSRS